MSEEYLIDAAEEGNLDQLQVLLQDHQLNINYKDKVNNKIIYKVKLHISLTRYSNYF